VERHDLDAHVFENLDGARDVPGLDEPAVRDEQSASEPESARLIAKPFRHARAEDDPRPRLKVETLHSESNINRDGQDEQDLRFEIALS
jgi:hypothetical protein